MPREAQRKYNRKRALLLLSDVLKKNFSPYDVYFSVTLPVTEKPSNEQKAVRTVKNYLNRVRRKRERVKKSTIEKKLLENITDKEHARLNKQLELLERPFRYVYFLLERPKSTTVYIILSSGLSCETCCCLWGSSLKPPNAEPLTMELMHEFIEKSRCIASRSRVNPSRGLIYPVERKKLTTRRTESTNCMRAKPDKNIENNKK